MKSPADSPEQRAPRSSRWKLVTLGCVVFAGIAWWSASYFRSRSSDTAEIRVRYGDMLHALINRDEVAALALIAPANRGKKGIRVLGLDFVVQELNGSSSISVSGDKAAITPRRVFHFYVLPGGNSVEMVKVDGEWYFSGHVSVD